MPANDFLTKNAAEVLDFPFDWTSALQSGETISTAASSVSPSETGGLAIDSGGSTVTSNIVSPICSGGLRGRRYQLICSIVTNQGRTNEQRRSIVII